MRSHTEWPEQACSWVRIALHMLSSALDPAADHQVDQWLYGGGTRAAVRTLRTRKPYRLTVHSAGVELTWTIVPVLVAPMVVSRDCARTQRDPAITFTARQVLPVPRRSLYPSGRPEAPGTCPPSGEPG